MLKSYDDDIVKELNEFADELKINHERMMNRKVDMYGIIIDEFLETLEVLDE